jgi:hypothetical protein
MFFKGFAVCLNFYKPSIFKTVSCISVCALSSAHAGILYYNNIEVGSCRNVSWHLKNRILHKSYQRREQLQAEFHLFHR